MLSSREKFEVWYIAHQRAKGYGAMLSDDEFVKRDPETGRYVRPVQLAWQAWQQFNGDGTDAEFQQAQESADLRGMAFVVRGKYVSAEDVYIVQARTGLDPISEMRKATAEAKAALADVVSIRRPLIDMLWSAHYGLGHDSGFVRHQTMLAIGGFLSCLPLDTYPRPKALEGLDAYRVKIEADTSPVVPHQCTAPKGGLLACPGCTCGARKKGMEYAPSPAAAPDELLDVNKPITPDAPGLTTTCMACGRVTEDGGDFCFLHNGS